MRVTTRRRRARSVRAALERVGGGLWRLADHRRQCRARIEQHDQPHLRHRGRRRLSHLAVSRWRALRSPAAAPISASPIGHRPLRPVPGRRLRPAHRRAGLYLRRAGLWLAGHHHQPHRDRRRHRSVAREVQRQCVFGPRSKAAIASSTPWIGGIGITPYAAGQFTTFDLPAYAEQALAGANTFALAYGAKSVTDARSELGLRTDKSFAMPNGDPDAARPRGLGA